MTHIKERLTCAEFGERHHNRYRADPAPVFLGWRAQGPGLSYRKPQGGQRATIAPVAGSA